MKVIPLFYSVFGRIIYSVNLLTYSDMSILAGIWDKKDEKKVNKKKSE